jgi:hypothetical protein
MLEKPRFEPLSRPSSQSTVRPAGVGRSTCRAGRGAARSRRRICSFGDFETADKLLFAGKLGANVGDRMCWIILFFGMKS